VRNGAIVEVREYLSKEAALMAVDAGEWAVSQKNMELLRRVYAADDQIAAIMEACAPDLLRTRRRARARIQPHYPDRTCERAHLGDTERPGVHIPRRLLVRYKVYRDRAEALKGVGLNEWAFTTPSASCTSCPVVASRRAEMPRAASPAPAIADHKVLVVDRSPIRKPSTRCSVTPWMPRSAC
jgi:hypothetical protein